MAFVSRTIASTSLEPPERGLSARLDALRHEDAAERREAARELSGNALAADALGRALADERDPACRAAMLDALVAIGGQAAATVLIPHLASEDAGLRNGAIEALQALGEAAGDLVRALLGNADPDQRIFAINVLETLHDMRASGWLRDVLATESHVNVGLAAVEALTQSGGPENRPALRDFASRFGDVPFVQFAVDLACRRVGAS